MKNLVVIITVLLLMTSAFADRFDTLKTDLSRAECYYFEFISVIESDIFDTVDSTFGNAIIASDGRYSIAIGEEEYLFDLKHFYTYVKSNNQLIIEKSDGQSNDNILFITKLDEFYKSYILTPDLSYRLLKREDIQGEFPDSLKVELDKKKNELKQIEYFDINEELNRIIFLKQQYYDKCNDIDFEPNYPDSVEKVRL